MRLDELFLDADAEGFHFAVEVGAFEAEGFGGAADVAVALVELLQDVVALVGFAGFEQGGELFALGCLQAVTGRVAATTSMGRCLRFDALGLGVEDQHALDQVAQFADVAGPVVLARAASRASRSISTWGRPYCWPNSCEKFA